MKVKIQLILISLFLLTFVGCKATGNHYAFAATGTVIGIELGENPATQMPHAKLGYNRAEIAVVPSNRSNGESGYFGNGAADTPEVIMELNFRRMLSRDGSIYQRLAIGPKAVQSAGSALMFGKDTSGSYSDGAEAVYKAATGAQIVTDKTIDDITLLTDAYVQSDKKDEFDEAARSNGYATFIEFIQSNDLNAAKLTAMVFTLKGKGLL